jgi:hypothetical protein
MLASQGPSPPAQISMRRMLTRSRSTPNVEFTSDYCNKLPRDPQRRATYCVDSDELHTNSMPVHVFLGGVRCSCLDLLK